MIASHARPDAACQKHAPQRFVRALAARIALVGFLGLSVLTPRSGLCAESGGKPNIVFIFADDWGWGDLSCHGHPALKTPHLDRLASQGIDFQQFNVVNPVCSPSRTAVTTGHYPARYCVHQHFAPGMNAARGMPDWLDPHAPTVARFLKQAGYRTGHFGKWHLTDSSEVDAPEPSAYGFDESAIFNGPGNEAGLKDTAPNAVKFIRENKGRPFYVNVWLHESHTAHFPSQESMELWKHLDPQQQVYSAVITDGDNAVGQVLDALKETGVEQNTIVIFSADNGPESTGDAKNKKMGTGYGTYYSVGQTGGLRGRKRSLFEGGVRVPFIVRWPGHAPAGVKNEITDFTAVDLLPTLCAAAGVALPADYHGDGENLLAAFEGQAASRTRPVFWQWRGRDAEPDWWPRLAVRDGQWKLLLTDDALRVELHRLPEDRAESQNVASDHPEVVARLTKLAQAWKATLPSEPNPECVSQVHSSKKGATKTAKPDKAAATPDRARAFQRWDTNHDDILTLSEYEAGLKGRPNLPERFKNFDANSDGKLTRAEFVGSADAAKE